MSENNAHYKEIGENVEKFQNLEQLIAFYTWYLISNDTEIGMRITPQLSFRGLCGVFQNIIAYRTRAKCEILESDEYKTLLKLLSRVEDERNKIVHSVWLEPEDDHDAIIYRSKIPRQMKLNLELPMAKFSHQDFQNVLQLISQALQKVQGIMEQLRIDGVVDYPID